MIPSLFHQIWLSDKNEPPPQEALELGQSWTDINPSFQYKLWRNEEANSFLSGKPKKIKDLFYNYEHNIQRVDCLKYLVLEQFGGVYVDLDYECIRPISRLLSNQECCLCFESDSEPQVIGNGFIASVSGSKFIQFLIDNLDIALENNTYSRDDKLNFVLRTTGPGFITNLYDQFAEKEIIRVYATKILSPLRAHESRAIVRDGAIEEGLRKRIEKAYAIHYSFSMWL